MDESCYLSWGWFQTHGGPLFYSLEHSNQPLIIWLFGLVQNLPLNPLLAGRLISVLFGCITMLGIYTLTSHLFSKKIATLASILYTLTPIFFFYNRQALMEPAVTAFSIWSLYLLVSLQKQPSLKTAFALGTVLGLGFFTKNTGLIFLFTTLIIFLYWFIKSKSIQTLTQLIYCLLAFCLISSPLFFNITNILKFTNNNGILMFPAITKVVLENFDIAITHLTPFMFMAACIGIYQLRNHRLLLVWFFLPLFPILFLVRSTNSRYLEPFLLLTPIFAAHFLSRHKILLALSFVSCLLYLGILILSPPTYFKLLSKISSKSYAPEYVIGIDTGYQVQATLDYLTKISDRQNIIVAIPSISYNPDAALEIYLRNNPHITITHLTSALINSQQATFDCISSPLPLYFVGRQNDTSGLANFLIKHQEVHNSYNSDFNTIYTLKSDCPQSRTIKLVLVGL